MIRAEKDNEKRKKTLRVSPVILRQREKEDRQRPKAKPTHDLIFEGMS